VLVPRFSTTMPRLDVQPGASLGLWQQDSHCDTAVTDSRKTIGMAICITKSQQKCRFEVVCTYATIELEILAVKSILHSMDSETFLNHLGSMLKFYHIPQAAITNAMKPICSDPADARPLHTANIYQALRL